MAAQVDVKRYFKTVITNVPHRWDDLADELGFERGERSAIESDKRDASHKCKEVLEKWREREGRAATLQVLKQALIDIGERRTADSLGGEGIPQPAIPQPAIPQPAVPPRNPGSGPTGEGIGTNSSTPEIRHTDSGMKEPPGPTSALGPGGAVPPSGSAQKYSLPKPPTPDPPKGSQLEGTERPVVILLINDEYGTSKGGISTINYQASQTPKGKAVVYATVLQLDVPKQDQEAADRVGVKLIKPDPRGKTEPSLDWLTDYHSVHFPDLPKDVTCIIGHANITDTAARNIHNAYYKDQADLIMFTHVLPEDTEYFKGGERAIKASEKEDAMLSQVHNAKAAFSVGERIFKHFQNRYRGFKAPREHHIFFPRPSKIFEELPIKPDSGENEVVVLSVGRVKNAENLKGYNLTARAIGIARNDVTSRMRWIARGIDKDDWKESLEILEANLNSGDLNPNLRPYGTQEDIGNDMMTAHLVLMPSRSEPFGLVGLEAIAAGIPVLISDKSGLADMIKKLVAEKKLPAGLKNRIVKTSMQDSDMDDNAKTWANKIRETLNDTDTAFSQAKEFKTKLLESKYWEESERKFLQACGVTDCDAQQQSSE